jgi:hypothetical protein
MTFSMCIRAESLNMANGALIPYFFGRSCLKIFPKSPHEKITSHFQISHKLKTWKNKILHKSRIMKPK